MERDDVLDLLRRIAATPLRERLVLGGSSGLYAVSEELPALTEDADFVVDADWLGNEEARVLEELAHAGFRHVPGSPTFLGEGSGLSFDLVGFSREVEQDRIGGGRRLPVMVFSDLGVVLGAPGAVAEHPTGGLALTAPALAAIKLLTVRHEKGGKDKLQALLLVDEKAGNATFRRELREILARFPPDRVADALADARAATLTLGHDLERDDPQAARYSKMKAAAERGVDILREIVEPSR